MHTLVDLLHQYSALMSPEGLKHLIEWGGYGILAAIIFAETGLLVGFFLPGDSLLAVAGVFAAQGTLNIGVLLAVLIPCAIVGDAVGYQFGKRVGPALFSRPRSLLFRPSHLVATKDFYDRHGGKAIIMARFAPFLRTFAPIVAGIGQMPYARFAMFNAVGGAGWIASMTLVGYFVGQRLDAKQFDRLVIAIVFVSILPVVAQSLLARRKSATPAPAVAKSE